MSSSIDTTKEVSNVIYNGREVPLAGTKSLLNNLCPEFAESGYGVACQPVEGYPLQVVSRLECKNLMTMDTVERIEDKGYWDYTDPVTFEGILQAPFTISCDYSQADTPSSKFTDGAAILSLIVDGTEMWVTGLDLISGYTITSGTLTKVKVVNWCEVTGTIKLQLERGTTATPYVPHPPFTEVKLARRGKNLIPYPYVEKSKTMNGITFTDNGDGSITINGTATADAYFILHNNRLLGDASINAINKPAGATDGVYAVSYRLFYNPLNDVLSVVIGSGSTVNNEIIYPQAELGSTATAYEPYREPTVYTKGLGQDVYGGSLNWNTGVLTIDWYFEEIDGVNKKFGNRYAWDNIVQYPITMQYGQSSALEGNIICSHFANRNSTADGSCYSYAGGNKDILVSMYDFATLEEANAWLVEQKSNGTPLTFCYEMYEPITIQLTPQEIIALSGTNILSSNAGIIEVSGKSNPVAVIRNLEDRLAALEAAVINNA